jgi:hypothetical protein
MRVVQDGPLEKEEQHPHQPGQGTCLHQLINITKSTACKGQQYMLHTCPCGSAKESARSTSACQASRESVLHTTYGSHAVINRHCTCSPRPHLLLQLLLLQGQLLQSSTKNKLHQS